MHVGQLLLRSQHLTEWVNDCWAATKKPMARGWWVGGKQDKGGWCHVTGRRGSVTLSVSQGDGCTLLGPAAPPALSEEPAAPDTDTHSHTDRPNMTCHRSHRRLGLMAPEKPRNGGIRENVYWIVTSWTGRMEFSTEWDAKVKELLPMQDTLSRQKIREKLPEGPQTKIILFPLRWFEVTPVCFD